ncbi:MAG: DNA translocase FtsK 4TM domain-containing protein [Candidatus Altimarinota bacterium]
MPRRRKTRKTKRTTVRYRRTRRTPRKTVQFSLSEHVSREISGIFFIGFAILNFLALQNNGGSLGQFWEANVLTPIFGIGAFIVPAFCLVIGLTLLFSERVEFAFGRVLGLTLFVTSALGLVQLSAPLETLFESSGNFGGYIGFSSNFILYILFGSTGAAVILTITAIISLLLIFNISFAELVSFFGEMLKSDEEPESATEKPRSIKEVALPKARKEDPAEEFELNIVRGDAEEKKLETSKKTTNEKPAAAVEKKIPVKTEEMQLNESEEEKVDYSDYQLPDLALLNVDTKNKSFGDDQLVQNAEIIRRKLEQFNVKVTMKDAHVGPTVIQYTLKPAEDVKLSKITTLKNDLALALSARAIRIEAPIPGKGLVGIEIPAQDRSIVHLGSIMRSPSFLSEKGDLKMVLGRDVSGQPVVADLVKMPHLLVAGQTGAGKSIGINSFIISLLYQHSPETLRMIMIDPKRVELTNYNGIPHLLTPVITEPDKALQSLKWGVSEMNRRYKELARHGKRNIDEYNTAFPENKMPFIVIIIDELADLMMAASKEIEATICRLAQMARATGIHLIIATQRPSVDVITGLIKANIPTRVAYTVATGIDSRTIIDSIGAEDLLGQGDMLFLASNMAKPLRLQGAFVSTKEIEKIIHFIKLRSPTGIQYDDTITEEQNDVRIPGLGPANRNDEISGDNDIEKAIQAIREGRKASASYLQRRCSFGYAKAARILDQLEEMGLIGPANGAKPRAIFISDDDEAAPVASEEHESISA